MRRLPAFASARYEIDMRLQKVHCTDARIYSAGIGDGAAIQPGNTVTDDLPPPVNFSDVQLPGNDAFNAAHAVWGYTADQMRAYGEDRAAAELRRWSDDLPPLPAPDLDQGWGRSDALLTAWRDASIASAVARERERCARLLEQSAYLLAPSGKRINQIDRHIATVLDDKAAAIRKGE